MSRGTIAQHRGWHNKSQEDVARATGVSVNTVSNYENGKSDPKFSFVQRFADWIGIDVSDIIVKSNHDDATDK